MYRGWDIFMANIWSTSSPKIYAFQDIGEKRSIMRLAGPQWWQGQRMETSSSSGGLVLRWDWGRRTLGRSSCYGSVHQASHQRDLPDFQDIKDNVKIKTLRWDVRYGGGGSKVARTFSLPCKFWFGFYGKTESARPAICAILRLLWDLIDRDIEGELLIGSTAVHPALCLMPYNKVFKK